MKRVLIIPAVLLAMLVGAMAWSGGGVEKRASFAFINRGDIYTFDLNQMSYMQDFRIMYGIREGLYTPEADTLKPIPAGAIGYELSDDKRVWTFHLRKECKWNNGDPVTAKDYVFSWRHMLEEPGEYTYLFYYIQGAQDYAKQLQIYFSFEDRLAKYNKDPRAYAKEDDSWDTTIADFEKVHPKPAQADAVWESQRKAVEDKLIADLKPIDKRPDFKTVGIESPDDLTLVVKLNDPVPYLLELVAFPPYYPRHEASMKPFLFEQNKKRGQYTYDAQYTRPPSVVTNGPFVLKRWDFKRRLILEKSATYWDRDHVPTDTIEMAVTDNPLSQYLLYESGKVDWQSDVDGDLAAELKAKGRTDLRVSPAFATAFLTFLVTPKLPDSVAKIANVTDNPLADVRVRQALAMSIDKRFIVDNITRMGELPARTYIPPDGTLTGFMWSPGLYEKGRKDRYDDVQMRALLGSADGLKDNGPGLPFDPKRAAELLAAAGYPGGKGFPILPIYVGSNSPARISFCQVLKNQWQQTLHIEVNLIQMEGKSVRDKVANKDYAIAPAAWYGDYPDTATFTDKYISTSKQNDSAWINLKYDDLCAKAAKDPDAKHRLELLSEAENMLDTEVPIVPLYHYVMTSLSRDNVKGVLPNPRGVTLFKGVKVER